MKWPTLSPRTQIFLFVIGAVLAVLALPVVIGASDPGNPREAQIILGISVGVINTLLIYVAILRNTLDAAHLDVRELAYRLEGATSRPHSAAFIMAAAGGWLKTAKLVREAESLEHAKSAALPFEGEALLILRHFHQRVVKDGDAAAVADIYRQSDNESLAEYWADIANPSKEAA